MRSRFCDSTSADCGACPVSRVPVCEAASASAAKGALSDCAVTADTIPGIAGTQDRMQSYVELVYSEIKATKALSSKPLTTVSFGGGVSVSCTPAAASMSLSISSGDCKDSSWQLQV